MADHILHTERLTLKPFNPNEPADYDRTIRAFNTFTVLPEGDPRRVVTREQLDRKFEIEGIHAPNAKTAPPKGPIFFIYLRDTDTFVGISSLFQRWVYPDLGWAIYPEYQGKGYATEASRAAAKFWTDTVGLTKIFASIKVGNAVSIRVAEKIGFVYNGTFVLRMPQGDKHTNCAYMLPGMKPFPEGFEADYMPAP